MAHLQGRWDPGVWGFWVPGVSGVPELRDSSTVNVLGQYVLRNPYEVVHLLALGSVRQVATNVPLHTGC